MTEDTTYEEFNKIIIKAAEATASDPIAYHKSWFEFGKHELLPAMDRRNCLMFQKFKLKSTMSTEPTEDQLEELKTINCSINRENKYISDQSNIALRKFYDHHANTISSKEFSSRLAWEAVEILAMGEKSHHKTVKSMSLAKPDGTHAFRMITKWQKKLSVTSIQYSTINDW
jgi:hypothetical protein